MSEIPKEKERSPRLTPTLSLSVSLSKQRGRATRVGLPFRESESQVCHAIDSFDVSFIMIMHHPRNDRQGEYALLISGFLDGQ